MGLDLCIAIDLPRKRIVILNDPPGSFEETKMLYSAFVEWQHRTFPLCPYKPIQIHGSSIVAANDFTLEWICRSQTLR